MARIALAVDERDRRVHLFLDSVLVFDFVSLCSLCGLPVSRARHIAHVDIVDSRAALEEAESKEEKRCDRVAGCLVFAAQL